MDNHEDLEVEKHGQATFMLMMEAQKLFASSNISRKDISDLVSRAMKEATSIKLPEQFPELLDVQAAIKELQIKDPMTITQEDLAQTKIANVLADSDEIWKNPFVPSDTQEDVEDLLSL